MPKTKEMGGNSAEDAVPSEKVAVEKETPVFAKRPDIEKSLAELEESAEKEEESRQRAGPGAMFLRVLTGEIKADPNPLRVHLDQWGNPVTIHGRRETNEIRGPQAERFKGKRAMEVQYAQELLNQRLQERLKRVEEIPFIQRFGEALRVMAEGQKMAENEAEAYGEAREKVVAGEGKKAKEQARSILMKIRPTEIIAERPLDYLSKPLVIHSPSAWYEILRLAEAVNPFTTPGELIREDPSRAGPITEGEALAVAIEAWVKLGYFDPEVVESFLRSLARVRDADSEYFEKMYESTSPQMVIGRLASLFSRTSKVLRQRAASEHEETLEYLAEVMDEESVMLRVIQAQQCEFVTYNRPIDPRVALLPLAMYVEKEVAKGPGRFHSEEIAMEVVESLRLHRCKLSDNDILAICSFFYGDVLPEEMKNSSVSHMLPWVVLNGINGGLDERTRFVELRKLVGTEGGVDSLQWCLALSRLKMRPDLTRQIVSDLILQFRKQGYLNDVDFEFYRRFGVDRELWELHNLELAWKKEDFGDALTDGVIVIAFTTSAFTFNEAHFGQVRAAKEAAASMVQVLEIINRQPIRKRRAIVLVSQGQPREKEERLHMPKITERHRLTTMALAQERDVWVLPPKFVQPELRSSVRVQTIQGILAHTRNLHFTVPAEVGFPTANPLFVNIQSTEKFEDKVGNPPATHYVRKANKLDEATEYLNSVAALTYVLKDRIAPARQMTYFVRGVLESWRKQGGALLLSHFSELHSEGTADLVRKYVELKRQGKDEAAERAKAGFDSAVPPRIQREGWKMMAKRAAFVYYSREEREEVLRICGVTQD